MLRDFKKKVQISQWNTGIDKANTRHRPGNVLW